MRTFLFQDYCNMTNGKFLPSVTFESQEFGRHFFIDANLSFYQHQVLIMVDMMRTNLVMFQSGQSGKGSIWINFLESIELWQLNFIMTRLFERG